jgi:hypothetical protein
MAALPETGLPALPVNDHINHHIELHKGHNLWTDSGTVGAGGIGLCITRITAGTDTETSLQVRQRHYVLPEQVMTVTHSAAGTLTFTVAGRHRAVKINASANISGLSVTGLDFSGAEYADINCLLVATGNITVDMSAGAIVVGSPPTSMSIGDSVPFQIQRWNF